MAKRKGKGDRFTDGRLFFSAAASSSSSSRPLSSHTHSAEGGENSNITDWAYEFDAPKWIDLKSEER
jgi:hypothetical protein